MSVVHIRAGGRPFGLSRPGGRAQIDGGGWCALTLFLHERKPFPRLCMHACFCGVLALLLRLGEMWLCVHLQPRQSSNQSIVGQVAGDAFPSHVRACTRSLRACTSSRRHPVCLHANDTAAHLRHTALARGRRENSNIQIAGLPGSSARAPRRFSNAHVPPQSCLTRAALKRTPRTRPGNDTS